MIEIMHPESWIIDTKDLTKIPDIERGALVDLDKQIDDFNRDSNRKPVKSGGKYVKPRRGLGASIAGAITALVLEQIITQTLKGRQTRDRRRLRVELCVKSCLGIIEDAQKAIEQGFLKTRAISTMREKRVNRKFESRK